MAFAAMLMAMQTNQASTAWSTGDIVGSGPAGLVDITGHGPRALRHVDVTSHFDAQMLPFKGIQYQGRVVDDWPLPGWTGSRGHIVRALIAPRRLDLVIGADGAGSAIRRAMRERTPSPGHATSRFGEARG